MWQLFRAMLDLAAVDVLSGLGLQRISARVFVVTT
jgi:hypothetical protein